MSDSPGASAGPGTPAPRAPSRRRRPSALTVVGLVLLLTGLSCLGWVGYQYLGTNLVSERAFDSGRQDLRQRWEQAPPATPRPSASPEPDPLPGDATALLRIPAFGADYEIPVLEGTDLDILAGGVGHYTGTAGPGEVGNFALAGHRVTHGQPFSRLLELDPGDEVVVETRTAVHTYVLDESPRALTVDDTATWVLDPVPGEPDREPTRALITLTTCQDLFRSPDRSVGFGHLQSTRNKQG
ncbi:MAG: putative membrane protein [uncultured Friedmanniella sp.]|uniref:Putative membrane protein n=1 Tax=uncultured Friedmanniella sp. TaxID=335381 RepID=A0A6J4LK22_9ACTN|nr:MAG: putative membrane protein [uncultured Friedmanniella sp.]